MKLKEHEESFDVKPIGVRYICEHCNNGEMIKVEPTAFDPSRELIMHRCDKCNGTLYLPKIYPYIEWVKQTEEE